MENRLIVERLKQEAETQEVADCIVRMFLFEVENAPKKKPHFREPFGECITSCLPATDQSADQTDTDDEQ